MRKKFLWNPQTFLFFYTVEKEKMLKVKAAHK